MLVEGKDYQIRTLNRLLKRIAKGVHRQILSLPTGGGKTWLALALAEAVTDERVVFVVPNELTSNTRDGIRALGYTGPLNVLRAESTRQKSEQCYGADSIPATGILLVGWSSLPLVEDELDWWMGADNAGSRSYEYRRDEVRAAAAPWARDLPRYYRPRTSAMLIMDEAHYGGNEARSTPIREKAQTWAEPLRIPSAVTRWPIASRGAVASRITEHAICTLAMTASTITEDRADIYGIVRLLKSASETAGMFGLHKGYKSEFRVKYCGAYDGQYGLVDGDPQHTEDLLKRLKPLMVQPSLPQLRKHFLPIVTEALRAPVTQWEPGEDAKWRRMTKGRKKKAALLRIRSTFSAVTGALAKHKTSIVFTEYKASASILGELLDCPVITGDTSDDDRERIKAHHKAHGGHVVATVYAMGHGHNLQYVDAILCAEIPVRLDLFLQSVGRGQRLGRHDSLYLYVVAVDGSKDVSTLHTWEGKVVQTQALTTHQTSHAAELAADGSAVDWASVFSTLTGETELCDY
jgi:hypothetical protein